MITREQFEAKSAVEKDRGFKNWLARPETRALVSMIPAADKPELVQLVLQAAYSSGYDTGSGQAILAMIESFMDRKPRS